MVSNGTVTLLMRESIWFDAHRYEEAERQYHEFRARERMQANLVNKPTTGGKPTSVVNPTSCGMSKSSLACEIAYARQKIQNFLKSGDVKTAYADVSSLLGRIENLEKEKNEMNNQLASLYSKYDEVLSKLSSMEKALQGVISPQGKLKTNANETFQNGPDSESDELDLFGSDEEDEDAAKLKEERLKAYADKKAKKPALVAKSSVILDVKPWDDETDMKAMEKAVREIKTPGLIWGASKLVPLAYGIRKLQIVAVVEDEKVSIDWLQETIQEIEDLVQSVDIAAFNKL